MKKKKKIIRLKIMRPLNKNILLNKIRDSEKVYNVDAKKIFKENYIPINKNLYKKYSITENSIPFKFGIFKSLSLKRLLSSHSP